MSPDSFIGRALLASGMLSRTQLNIALKWLEESPAGGLGDLLCTNGVLSRTTYDSLMRFYKKDNSRVSPATGNRDRGVREAQLFCLVAMREQEITVEQLRDGVDGWVRLEGMGKPRPIGEVFLEKGYLDLARCRALLEKTKEATLGCSGCGQVDQIYKVNGSPFTCDSCKAPLVATRVKEEVAAAPSDPLAGKVIGGCRLDEKIGQGRWTVVYKGLIAARNETAAIKLFAPETPPAALFRYIRDATAAIPLSHPALQQVFAAGTEDGRSWILTEYVPDAKPPTPREKLGWNKLCKAAIDLSRALGVVHAHGLIHGNVRPASVLLKESGAKLVDFGQAHDGPLPVPCDPMITAPELWKGEPFDSHADLYALGVTLYALATGRPPFVEANLRELEVAHRSTEPRPPGALNLELPRAVSTIILKLLAKDPAARYHFAEEVARDFEAVVRGESPVVAGQAEEIVCQFCKSPNPGTEKTCIVCGKTLSVANASIFLDDEFPCPKCERAINPQTRACECGFRPCIKCHQVEADPETGYCSNCLTAEAAAELKRKKAFRGPPRLVRPGAAGKPVTQTGLKPPPPPVGGPRSSTGLKPAPPPAKPATVRNLKPPPPPAKPAADDLDFDSLPPPAASRGAAPAPPQDDDLDFDSLPPPRPADDPGPPEDDAAPPDGGKNPPPPPPREPGLLDRRRR